MDHGPALDERHYSSLILLDVLREDDKRVNKRLSGCDKSEQGSKSRS